MSNGDIVDRLRRAAAEYAERGDPTGWFDEYYRWAEGDIHKVHWADLAPGPRLVAWIAAHPAGGRAVVVGCGLGDDAEALADAGYRVVAFDISAAAIAMCRERFPASSVQYVVADLLDHPADWAGAFDLVYECNTIQALLGDDLRRRVRRAVGGLVAPGGVALVSCRSRDVDETVTDLPIPLDRREIDGFVHDGLVEEEFHAYDDDQDPPVPHFFAVYRRPASER